ncbi:MAG: hypothetical protein QF464_08785, partial [Myxococcota bacterium]|nr:hypothetical protein [Myxococcota bacterium]
MHEVFSFRRRASKAQRSTVECVQVDQSVALENLSGGVLFACRLASFGLHGHSYLVGDARDIFKTCARCLGHPKGWPDGPPL